MTKTSKKSSTSAKSASVKLAVVSSSDTDENELPEAAGADAGAGAEAGSEAGSAALMLKKKDFVDRVVAVSGAKKPVVRDITEAVLSVLGEALSKGESLILPPLGKLRVSKQIDKSGTEMLQIRLKRGTGEGGAKKGEKTAEAPLAEGEE